MFTSCSPSYTDLPARGPNNHCYQLNFKYLWIFGRLRG